LAETGGSLRRIGNEFTWPGAALRRTASDGPVSWQSCRSERPLRPTDLGRDLPVRRLESGRSVRFPGLRPVTNPLQSLPGRLSNDSFGRPAVRE